MTDIVERMLDSTREYVRHNNKRPTTIYLGWYEMHEYKTSDIFRYYQAYVSEDEPIKFHNFDVFEVRVDSHFNIT